MTKIAIAQINPVVGDLAGNIAKIMAAYNEAAIAGAELVIAPECVLTGYPLEDLVLRESFMESVGKATYDLCQSVLATGHTASIIFGAPMITESQMVARIQGDIATRIESEEVITLTNAAYLLDPLDEDYGGTNGYPVWRNKYELPNYGVFDEKRVFAQGEEPAIINWRGHKLGLMICEDAWFPTVSRALHEGGAQFLISINGSPFEVGKNITRRKVVAERIKETGLPFLYVNLVGGQDELVFDGGSFLYDGNTLQEAPHFKEGIFCFDGEIVNQPTVTLDNYPKVEPTGIPEIYQACVMGLRDYVTKQGFKKVLLGYSGGVDSGLVAALACDALGPENVLLVRLPSLFSSKGSLTDAADGAERLGAEMRTIKIEPVVEALRVAYETTDYNSGSEPSDEEGWLVGVADENIQARARGTILMAISNQEGHMLLSTGNKSEVSVGYSTLYGDMSGGFNPIKDCYKVTVWELCRWRNTLPTDRIHDFGFKGKATEVVPEAIIIKPPSAELRPNQRDSDSLPPYPVLDAMLKAMIEDELSVSDITTNLNIELGVVQRIRRLVDNAEYKRRQAAPGVKITSKIHGRDRRYPIVNNWRG